METWLQFQAFLCNGDEKVDDDGHPDLGLHSVGRSAVEGLDPQMPLDPFEEQLSGKGLARCLSYCPARFQPLPIGTAREVFPQAARPVDFAERVMCPHDASGRFHLYASAFSSGRTFQSQNSPRTP